MFFDHVFTVAILWQRFRLEWTWKSIESLPKIGIRNPTGCIQKMAHADTKLETRAEQIYDRI